MFKHYSIKSLVLLSAGVFLFISKNSIAQKEVQIGNGNETNQAYPLNTSNEYGWSNFIFYNHEIYSSGTLSKLSFQTKGIGGTLHNQKIYLRHTKTTKYSTSNHPTISGFSLVYNGSIDLSTEGWKEIVLQSPFEYNGTDNLEILIENRSNSNSNNTVSFYNQSKSSARLRWNGDNTTFQTSCPPANFCGLENYIPNTRFYFSQTNHNWCGLNTGTASKTVSTDKVVLQLSNFTGNLVTWQWSIDGNNFTNLSNGSANPTNVYPSTTTYYRALVKINDDCQDFSNVLAVSGIGLEEIDFCLDNGTADARTLPTSNYYGYSWSNSIYLTSEMGNAGEITQISYHHYPVSTTIYNQKIYMRHTSSSAFTSPYYPGTSGFTLVYDGNLTFSNYSWWKDIPLTTHFDYNGTDNLEILILNQDGYYSPYDPTVWFKVNDYISTYRTRRDVSDYYFPSSCSYCTAFKLIPNISFKKLISGGNTATNIIINTENTEQGNYSYVAPGIAGGTTMAGTPTSEIAIVPSPPIGGGVNSINLFIDDPKFPGDVQRQLPVNIYYNRNLTITDVKAIVDGKEAKLKSELYDIFDGNKIHFSTENEQVEQPLGITINNLNGIEYDNSAGPFQIVVPHLNEFNNPKLSIFKDGNLISSNTSLSWDGTSGGIGLYQFELQLGFPNLPEPKVYKGQFIIK